MLSFYKKKGIILSSLTAANELKTVKFLKELPQKQYLAVSKFS